MMNMNRPNLDTRLPTSAKQRGVIAKEIAASASEAERAVAGAQFPPTKKTRAEIEAIISQISFMDRTYRLLEKGDGYLLQLQYYEADIENPEGPPVLQRARKWYISPWMTETEIVETAFAAARRSMDHVLKEHFTYKGQRVYSPHFDINARLELAQQNRFDRRPDGRTL